MYFWLASVGGGGSGLVPIEVFFEIFSLRCSCTNDSAPWTAPHRQYLLLWFSSVTSWSRRLPGASRLVFVQPSSIPSWSYHTERLSFFVLGEAGGTGSTKAHITCMMQCVTFSSALILRAKGLLPYCVKFVTFRSWLAFVPQQRTQLGARSIEFFFLLWVKLSPPPPFFFTPGLDCVRAREWGPAPWRVLLCLALACVERLSYFLVSEPAPTFQDVAS